MNNIIRRKIILFFVVAFYLLVLPVYGKSEVQNSDKPIEIEIETNVEDTSLEKFIVTENTITEKKILRLPVKSLPELLNTLTGLESFGTGNKKGKSEISIRGFGVNYLKVFIDGVPINNANDRVVDFSLIPLEIIEKVEIIKGPAPVTYGTDSMGGIINIITKKGLKKNSSFVKVMGGNYGTFEASALLGGREGSFRYLAFAKRKSIAGWHRHTREEFTDLFFKGSHSFSSDTHFSCSFISTVGERQAVNPEYPQGNIYIRPWGFWGNSYNWEYPNIDQKVFNIKLEKESKKNLGYRFIAYYKKYDDTLRAYVDPNARIKPGANSPFAYYRAGSWNYSYWDSYTYGGDLRITIPTGKHFITAGTCYDRPYFRDTYLGRSSLNDPLGSMSLPQSQWSRDFMSPWQNVVYASTYLQDEIHLNPHLTFTLGLREDMFSRTSPSLNGVVNLVYKKGYNTMRASLGKTNRFPNLAELEGPKGGNPNLKPEKGYTWEIGYRHKNPKFINFETAIYYSYINNLIVPTNPNDAFSLRINAERVKIFGVETNLEKRWKNITGRLGYAYNNRTSPDYLINTWEEVPKHQFIGEIRWEKKNSLCWSLQGLIKASKKTAEPLMPRIPSYGIVNARVAYPGFGSGDTSNLPWNVEFTVTNLFDKKYQARALFPEPGRWVMGNLKFRF